MLFNSLQASRGLRGVGRKYRSDITLFLGTLLVMCVLFCFFFFQAEDGIRDLTVTGVQTCALPISEAGPLGGLFGRRLYQALARVLPRGRAIIFVPRRGYADFLLCHECGSVPRCPRCGVALTYHVERAAPSGSRSLAAARVELRCHLCNHTEPVPQVCPQCQGTQLR